MAEIVIADQYPVVRIGLRHVFGVTRDFCVVAEVGHSSEVLQLLGRASCDLLVLDPAMPDLPLVEMLGHLRRNAPASRVLVFGINNEEDFTLPLIGMGAAGYLHKRSQPEQILLAARTVLGGDTYLAPRAARTLMAGNGEERAVVPHLALSRREMGVLLMLGAGRPLKRIATELNLSTKTVSTYRSRVLQKLGLASNADLTRYVIERRLA